MSIERLAERVYRTALALYPPAFRERFGDEMSELARDRLRAARAAGMYVMAGTLASLMADAVRSAPGRWVDALCRTRSETTDTMPPGEPMNILIQDLRFAFRSLLRRPGFTLVAGVTLALGIGANTAAFSTVDAVLVRPLPFDHPDQLVLIWGAQGRQGGQGVVYADYADWRQRNRTFSDMGVFRVQSLNLTGGETPQRLVGSFVSASFLRVINARAAKGRLFDDSETEPSDKVPVAIVSNEAWQSKFGGDPGLLGKQLVVNGSAVTVVGITTPRLPSPMMGRTPPDVMLPIAYYPNARAFERGQRGVLVAGRMKPGVTVEAAQRDLAGIARQLEHEFPATNAGTGADVILLREQMVGRSRDRLYIILASVSIVLLIACANVANLQLARGAARARELSVRAALGAGRRRLAQQLLTESVVLSVVGGVAGIALAFVLVKVLVATIGPSLPVDPDEIRLNGRVLLFALAVSVTTGILFGVAPAWKMSRVDLNDMLRSRIGGGFAHVATRNTLVVVQLALSLALLASAGLITRSLVALERVDPGFDPTHMLTAQFRIPASKYDSPDKIWSMFERVLAELRAVPGVQSAALVRASPFSQNGDMYPVTVADQPLARATDAPQVLVNSVTPGYFATMRIPLLSGRDVVDTDRPGTLPVVLVNKSFADKTWPGESPIGKRLKVGGEDWRAVVGVVGDTKHWMVGETQFLQAYIPYAQQPQIFTSIVVRANGGGNPLDLAHPVRAAIQRVDRDQPVWAFSTMERDVAGGIGSTHEMSWLLGAFALVALLVAAVGTYGVLSYTMSQRTQELGIRIALGANAGQVRRMVVGEGARLISVAVAVGLVASMGASRLLQSQLYGVGPHDFTTFGVVTIALSTVAILACYLPARRASRVDPMVALRAE